MIRARCFFCKETRLEKCFEILIVHKNNIVRREYICKPCAGTKSFLYVDKNNVVKHNSVERLYKSSCLDDYDD